MNDRQSQCRFPHPSRSEFDKKAPTWDDKPERAHWARLTADAIAAVIPDDPSLTALEYGCGTGQLSFLLRPRFAAITLADSSPGMLQVVRAKIAASGAPNLQPLQVDLLETPQAIAHSFAVIYSLLVLHHIADIPKILACWYRLLQTPGYLCVADLDNDNGLFHRQGFAHHDGFARPALRRAFEAAGFVNVRSETLLQITREGRDGVVRSFPVFLMVGEKQGGAVN